MLINQPIRKDLIMTKLEEILTNANKTIDDIEKIYFGKDHCCRCGCGGDYFEANCEEDARGFKRNLNKINTKPLRIDEIEYVDDIYVNIPLVNGNDKCVTIYWK